MDNKNTRAVRDLWKPSAPLRRARLATAFATRNAADTASVVAGGREGGGGGRGGREGENGKSKLLHVHFDINDEGRYV